MTAERLSGLCWSNINDAHPEVEQLIGEQWDAIASKPSE